MDGWQSYFGAMRFVEHLLVGEGALVEHRESCPFPTGPVSLFTGRAAVVPSQMPPDSGSLPGIDEPWACTLPPIGHTAATVAMSAAHASEQS